MFNSDFILTVVIPVASIIIGIIGIYLAFKFRKKRILHYSFQVRRKIFSNTFSDVDNFNLSLNNKPVRDLFLVELQIENKGNVTIYEKDFYENMELSFNGPVNLFPIRVQRSKSDIPVKYEHGLNGNNAFFKIITEFIEPKDKLTFSILYENDSYAEYVFNCRIINGKAIYKYIYEEAIEENYNYRIYRKYKHKRKTLFYVILIFLMSAFSFSIKYFFPDFSLENENLTTVQSIIQSLGYIFVLGVFFSISVYLSNKYYEKKQIKEIEKIESELEKRKSSQAK